VIYQRAQIAAAWCDAGGDPETAGLAAAVALGESGGDLGAINPTDGRIGLWQAPSRRRVDLADPIDQAREAIARSNNGTNWHEFPAYKMGVFRNFLPNCGRGPVNNPGKWSAYFQAGRRYFRVEIRRHSGQAEAVFMTGRARNYPEK
jgi:hypothetical protein